MTRFRIASESETNRALRLVFEQAAPDAADAGRAREKVDVLRNYLARQPGWLEGVWVAERSGHLQTACALVASPGRTATILFPNRRERFEVPLERDIAGALRAMIEQIDVSRFHLVQAIIETDVPWQDQVLAEAGLRLLADLVYEERTVTAPVSAPRLPEDMTWRRHRPDREAAFESLLERTYEGSLDCPALNGLRRMNDVVAGHMATGQHDPGFWLLLCDGSEQPVACLLTARSSYMEGMEIVYMGVVPEARGRGLGGLLVAQAVHLAGRHDLGKVMLTVDVANSPARHLYRQADFIPTDTRRAWIWSALAPK